MPNDIDQLRQSVAELRACLLTMPNPQQVLSHVPVLAAHVARLEGANIADWESHGERMHDIRALRSELNMAENLIGNALGFYSKWLRMIAVEMQGYDRAGGCQAPVTGPTISCRG